MTIVMVVIIISIITTYILSITTTLIKLIIYKVLDIENIAVIIYYD